MAADSTSTAPFPSFSQTDLSDIDETEPAFHATPEGRRGIEIIRRLTPRATSALPTERPRFQIDPSVKMDPVYPALAARRNPLWR